MENLVERFRLDRKTHSQPADTPVPGVSSTGCTVPHTVGADRVQMSKVKLLLCDSTVKGLPPKLLHPFAPNPL